MPANTSRTKRRHVKVRSIVTVILLGVSFIVVAVIHVGRVPISGNISVDTDQSDRFAQIMKENGIMFWSGIGGWGMMDVQFDNPFDLSAIDDVIIEVARRHIYRAIVTYKCLMPYFDHSLAVNCPDQNP